MHRMKLFSFDRYLEGHTFEAEQLNKVFEAIRSSIAKQRGCDPRELAEEDLIGMMEQVVEHSRFVGQEMEEGEELADAQDHGKIVFLIHSFPSICF